MAYSLGEELMKTAAVIQARMGSTRLPGKSLVEIAGQPLLGHVIDRTKACQLVHEVVLATTIEPEDTALIALAGAKGIGSYRGSVDDVLDRFYQAALSVRADNVVRITADDPFKDPEVIDLVIQRLLDRPELDYASNTMIPTFPEGLDVEVFRFSALAKAWRESRLMSEREHITPYIWKNPSLFRLENVAHGCDLSKLRWTLDYEADLAFTRAVYHRLYSGRIFGMGEILRLLEAEPNLALINTGIQRNAGYLKSTQNEQKT
jgi:spore coat polysaccharide biosynthesis protein SpsF (cytidylyltransferase family)